MKDRRVALLVAATATLAVVAVGAWIAFGGLAGLGAANGRGAVPHFVDEATGAGVSHRYDGEFEYFVGGGVAAFDCNQDQLPDLYFAGGSEPAALFVNGSSTAGPLQFERLANPATDLTAVTGAYPIDIDGDGLTDLAVLRRGENVLLRGTGRCQFQRANEDWGFDGGAEWTTAFSATWEDGSTWPTVAIGNYHDQAFTDPDELCQDNELLRPAPAQGGFGPAQPLGPSWCPLSMLFSDWSRTGQRDLRVSNDRHYYDDYSDGEEQLWNFAAADAPRLYGTDDGWQRVRVWGMGIASYDVTGDGYPEYYLTSQGDNKLQTLADGPAEPRYEDMALTTRVTATRPYEGDTTLASTAWHDEFQDVNNDGFVDLFVAKGNVEAMPDFAARDPSNLFLGGSDGQFVEQAPAAGIEDFARARGAAVVDLNADGLLDIVVVMRRENVRLWRNVGAGTVSAPAAMGDWLELKLADDGRNRDAIGSWIEVRTGERTQTREMTIGGGHVSGEMTPAHFGLGNASRAEFRVTWPDGQVGDWTAVDANSFYRITRTAAPEKLR